MKDKPIKQIPDRVEQTDPAMNIPPNAEVYYQGEWRRLFSMECVPPYQFMVWDLEGMDGVIQVPVTERYRWSSRA